ncbi:MAG: HPr family phosphocarrier protein [Treponema sp.]|jgi:phosphocarrier protein|nr:HPr family phosphocarrier protein [Treponema sp.]
MISKEITVTNKIGFHARPASLLIHTAQKYKSGFTLAKNGQKTSLDSLISLMKLRVKCGDVVTLSVEGPDEREAMEELVTLIKNRFGEEA